MPAASLRLPALYQGNVPATAAGAAADEALRELLRQILVRATGMPDAGHDPALAAIVQDARRYLRSLRPLTSGGSEVVFDGAALERAVQDAGRRVWNLDRPLTLVVLRPAPAAQDADETARRLQDAGQARGLPLSMALGQSLGSNVASEREPMLAAAQRLGGNAVLLGRASGMPAAGLWQWTLYGNGETHTWSGGLEEGVGGAVDALAAADQQLASQPAAGVGIEVAEVASLADHAALLRLLAMLPGVESVNIVAARPSGSLTLRIVARGGAEAVTQALARATLLEATEAGRYRFRH